MRGNKGKLCSPTTSPVCAGLYERHPGAVSYLPIPPGCVSRTVCVCAGICPHDLVDLLRLCLFHHYCLVFVLLAKALSLNGFFLSRSGTQSGVCTACFTLENWLNSLWFWLVRMGILVPKDKFCSYFVRTFCHVPALSLLVGSHDPAIICYN